MTIGDAQIDDFFLEATEGQSVWTVDSGTGVPVAMTPDGRPTMPFWSLESRLQSMVAKTPEYSGFATKQIALAEWTNGWLPGLKGQGILIGLNWVGGTAAGYDVEADAVLARLSA